MKTVHVRRASGRREAFSKNNERSTAATAGTVLALSVSIYSISLTLLSYGYDLAYLGEFDLSPEMLQRTPLDFLLRSYKVVNGLAGWLSGRPSLGSVLESIWVALWESRLLFSTLVVGALISCLACGYCMRQKIYALAQRLSLVQVVSPVHRKATWPRFFGWVGWILPTIVVYATTVGLYLLWLVLANLACFFLVIVPYLGTPFGKADAQKLMHAKQCGSGNDKAACVRILENGCDIARGRLIDTGGNRVFLYPLTAKPGENTVESFPLEGKVLQYFADNEAATSVQETEVCAKPLARK